MKKAKHDQQIRVRCERALLQAFDKHAKRQNIPRSQLLRDLMQQHITKTNELNQAQ